MHASAFCAGVFADIYALRSMMIYVRFARRRHNREGATRPVMPCLILSVRRKGEDGLDLTVEVRLASCTGRKERFSQYHSIVHVHPLHDIPGISKTH